MLTLAAGSLKRCVITRRKKFKFRYGRYFEVIKAGRVKLFQVLFLTVHKLRSISGLCWGIIAQGVIMCVDECAAVSALFDDLGNVCHCSCS